MDDFIAYLKELAERDDSVLATDLSEASKVVELAGILKEIVDGEDVSVDYKINKPFPWTGSVVIRGKSIEVADTRKFVKAIMIAENCDFMTKLNGDIEMAFGFNHLATEVG